VTASDRDQVVRCLEHLLEVDPDTRAHLRADEIAIRRAIKEIKKGSPIATTMETTDARSSRANINTCLEALYDARHQLRLAITTAGLDEGMTIGDLGRAWGISRQLASRFAREAREGTA
jgi:hypothetical protein